MTPRREPVSIVSVWNNEQVRQDCLDRSLERLLPTAPRTEYVPVDNRGQHHPTAGGALNLGARLASRDYVAFVQQDIYLHSLEALEEAAGLLADDARWGMLGAVGVSPGGRIIGRIRDRVVLIGDVCRSPAAVDSLDEVLFVLRRADVVADPLSESPDLAWHAYAVEYGLRLRERGLETGVVDIPITHNSLSTNLARLDEAHAAVARMHPRQVPTRTTCGTITAEPRTPIEQRFLAKHRWRLRWLRGSWAARRARLVTASRNILLSDIRMDIGHLLAESGGGRLRIHNLTPPGTPFPESEEGTDLRRGDYLVHFTSGPFESLGPLEPGASMLVTNVTLPDLERLSVSLPTHAHAIGYNHALGYWLALGTAAVGSKPMREAPRSVPFRPLV